MCRLVIRQVCSAARRLHLAAAKRRQGNERTDERARVVNNKKEEQKIANKFMQLIIRVPRRRASVGRGGLRMGRRGALGLVAARGVRSLDKVRRALGDDVHGYLCVRRRDVGLRKEKRVSIGVFCTWYLREATHEDAGVDDAEADGALDGEVRVDDAALGTLARDRGGADGVPDGGRVLARVRLDLRVGVRLGVVAVWREDVPVPRLGGQERARLLDRLDDDRDVDGAAQELGIDQRRGEGVRRLELDGAARCGGDDVGEDAEVVAGLGRREHEGDECVLVGMGSSISTRSLIAVAIDLR